MVARRRASCASGRAATPLATEYFLMKYSASSITSAGRSRKGGSFRLTTLSRNSKSSRKVFSRTASARLRFEVAMMRMSISADRGDHPFVDGAQQFCLQPHLHLGNLVEQERAAIGFLELADAACHRAGE